MNKINYENEIGFEDKLKSNKPLTVKLGFDPTSPDLHLGHYVVLKGAKKLQDMGHNVSIIVGDFTAAIGDPSGRNKLRPPLTQDEILKNADTYTEQVFKVLDKTKTKICFNSSWLDKMSIKDLLAILSTVTVSQILVRDDFKKRFDAQIPIHMHEMVFEHQIPIHMHEMVYPLMQGLDSVAIKADVELGGTDQTFNLLMGRQLQKDRKLPEQAVLTFPLLVGLDGEKKMSKSLGNHIGILENPTDMFGKIMSISDTTMWNYYEILLEFPEVEINKLKNSNKNPKDIKLSLAENIVSIFHGEIIANKMKQEFIDRFSNKKIENIEEITIELKNEDIALAELIKDLSFANSISDAGRKMEQSGVKLNSELIKDKKTRVNKNESFILQVGKLNIKKIKLR